MKVVHYILLSGLVALLFAIRFFENQLFYDPLLAFFKSDFRQLSFPEIHQQKHILSIAIRYSLNTLISLGIIHLLFRNVKHTIFSLYIFLAIGIIVHIAYIFWLHNTESISYTAAFYIRRILLQPMLLLVLVPAIFYMQIKRTKSMDA